MAEYAFKLKAQAWRTDPYYVASSHPVHEVEVIAATEREACDEARKLLTPLNRSFYYRFWLISARDIRIPAPSEEGKP